MAKITVIPANDQQPLEDNSRKRKLKVAAYARVSTDTEEQLNSYATQCEYYREKITSNPDYEFVAVYSDEGVTGTSIKNRDGFNQMVKDALDGKIDLILIKSVSRLGRNTVDNLNAVRALRAKGVEIFFENQNMGTLDPSSEFLITLYSSLAQEESRSISDNVGWSKKKLFEKGVFALPYKQFLGYEKGPDGKPAIVEKEAKIVRRIYKLFLHGSTPRSIAQILTDEGIPTPSGRNSKWSSTTVSSILQNEKYCGCALLQKCFVPDFLTHKSVPNKGQLQQYFIEDSHPAIIPRETFELVQHEFRVRESTKRATRISVFSGRVICGDCGGAFGSKVWHSNDERYRKEVYRCNKKYDKSKEVCQTPHITEQEIKDNFIKVVNRMVDEEDFLDAKETILEHFAPDPKKADKVLTLQAKAANIESQVEMLINSSAKDGNMELFQRQYDLLREEHDSLLEEIDALELEIRDREVKRIKIAEFYESIKSLRGTVQEYSDDLWVSLIDRLIVNRTQLVFVFKDGTERKINWKGK